MSSSKVSSKSSVNSIKAKPAKPDVYDQWRPPAGIRYELSQTQIDLIANLPNLKVKYTTVEYEPGQDLTVKSESAPQVRYAKPRGRGPVFRFQEEIDDENNKKIQQQLLKSVLEKCVRLQRAKKKAFLEVHHELVNQIGPIWYQELSVKQMQSADSLKDAMKKDYKQKTIINTQEMLGSLGIVYTPNHTKIEYALKKYFRCPVEFLLTLFRLNRPKNNKEAKYTVNDRIMLSAVVHLSLREIFREMHLRTPSPPGIDDPKTHKKEKPTTKIKVPKGTSPYLIPIIPVEQHHINEVYKNRHKEYAYMDYFDYKDDMWSVTVEDDLDSVVKRVSTYVKESKWSRPPKIPVRLIESKMKKKKVYRLKKPSAYICPCKEAAAANAANEEAAGEATVEAPAESTRAPPGGAAAPARGDAIAQTPEEDINVAPEDTNSIIITNIQTKNICCCAPSSFNENTSFQLKIKITTAEEEIFMSRQLCPYSSKNVIGDLKLESRRKLDKSAAPCIGDNDEKAIKQIEYSCECCICGKVINLAADTGSLKSTSAQPIVRSNIDTTEIEGEFTEKAPSYPYIGEEYEDVMEDEYHYMEENICQCVTPSTSESDINDPYYLCTCASSNDDCTCCLCNDMDKDFILKIKRYNEVFGTDHKPCQCFCKCKKKRKKPPPKDDDICKYCFCPKKKPIVEDYGEEEEEENISTKKRVTLVLDEVTGAVQQITDSSDGKTSIINVISESAEGEVDYKCKCQNLYDQYLDAHDSCMSLFQHYQDKLIQDVEEYLTDIKENRCVCLDSESTVSGEFEEESENYEQDEMDDIDMCCNKYSRKPGTTCCCCSSAGYNTEFKGCTCNPAETDITGCVCNEPSSSSSSEITDTDPCACGCTCGQGPCQCREFVEKVREIRAANRAANEAENEPEKKPESVSPNKPVNGAAKEKGKVEAKPTVEPQKRKESVKPQEPAEPLAEIPEEVDPRIIVLDKFPKSKREQMELLKLLIAALAEDGYPMASLPQVELLPQFGCWMNFRSRTYISMDERDRYYKLSQKYWAHSDVCKHKNELPDWPIPKHVALNVYWDKVNTYQKIIAKSKEEYSRKSKQTFINQGQEFFPTIYHYLFYTKTFRDCFFSYLPPDENHCFVFKPWEAHEHKDPSKRKPCM